MAYTPISGTVPQYSNASNELASDHWLKFYIGITTTPLSMATDSYGTTLLAKCKLNSRGEPITSPNDNNSVFIPYINQTYRIVLYKSEVDADNNTTANAEFNVGGVPATIAPSANAADVALRGTTLLSTDDYDRSPLFDSISDFTTGAGPHVITVPAGWVPTDPDMRFHLIDSSGIISELFPTTKTATTYTIQNTLLSSDRLFIGDDKFRSLFDGDPLDIRTRLDVYEKADVYTKTESNANFLNESSNLSDLPNKATARTNLDVYSTTESNANFLNESSNLLDLDNTATARTNLDVYSKAESDANFLDESSNLSDLPSTATARTNLDVYSKSESDANFLNESSNLSDLTNTTTARTNLGVYGTSEVYTKTESDSAYLNESSNLSDLTNTATARTNLDVYSKAESSANFLNESSNLSDLTDTAAARTNLDVFSKAQNILVAQFTSPTRSRATFQGASNVIFSTVESASQSLSTSIGATYLSTVTLTMPNGFSAVFGAFVAVNDDLCWASVDYSSVSGNSVTCTVYSQISSKTPKVRVTVFGLA
tara:strand:+ start:235 stop:1860 length:1626 start_codon:yes stop_codon:yes gene_type:complete